jgi:hypothetical protein
MKNGERIEFSFYEAGCLIWVGAKDLGGLSYQEFSRLLWSDNPIKVLEQQIFLAMDLYQDDGYLVRVVLGELTPQEEEEWVARVRWKLNLTCGAMIVSGILDEDESVNIPSVDDLNEEADILQCYVEVPPAIYQVEIYSYPPGDLSTGWGQITDPDLFPAEPGIQPESIKDYFLRTRQMTEIPPWIAYEITENKRKKREILSTLDDISYVNFVIRLSPIIDDDLPLPKLDDDNSVAWEFRKPEKCPLGILANKQLKRW